MIIECIIELNWSCKHIKKVRSSEPTIILNWIKHSFSLWVLLKELRNCVLGISRGWSLFCSIQVTKACIFYLFFWKTSFLSVPSGHRTSFGRSMDVYMKSGLHINVHGMSKGRLIPTGSAQNLFKKFKKSKLYFGNLVLAALQCHCGDNGHKMPTSLPSS